MFFKFNYGFLTYGFLNYGQTVLKPSVLIINVQKSFYFIFSKIMRKSGIIKTSTEQGTKGQREFPFASEIKKSFNLSK